MANVKKPGRKPRGGKLVLKTQEESDTNVVSSCIVIQLRCHLRDLDTLPVENGLVYNPDAPPAVESYQANTIDFAPYDDKTKVNVEEATDTSLDTRLRDLKVQLYKQTINKQAACFWCTYEFDSPACYIPRSMENDDIVGYGSFCCPECAVAYLFKETLDDAVRFERYSMLNYIYGKVYKYTRNIRAAPDPHYLLEKFYGNLSITEYRKMIGSEHVLVQLDKPISRLMPEIHSEGATSTTTGDTLMGSKYCVKRESEKKKGPSKKSLIAGHFGIQ